MSGGGNGRRLGAHPCFRAGEVACSEAGPAGSGPSPRKSCAVRSGMGRAVGRAHLPVAPRCNIRCAYCDRKISDCYHGHQPGVAARVIRPDEVPAYVERALAQEPRVGVLGVAGPGEPLANEETFEALAVAGRAFPRMTLCLSTNGLLLERRAARLADLGVTAVTVTVNAADAEVGARIYRRVPATRLLRAQSAGIEAAARLGMAVKVNTVLIPGVNEASVAEIARIAAERGAHLQNIMPLIPLGEMAGLAPPTAARLAAARSRAARFLPQFMGCRQCRADAVGMI